MDYIHQLEADQPMLSFFKGAWDKLLAHAIGFADDNSELTADQIPSRQTQAQPGPNAR
jgi:hypothetical protein